jgi:large subunit ribosomal protein L6
MSRIGKLPVVLPAGVEVTVAPGRVTVKGPRGTLEQAVSPDIAIAQQDDRIVVTRPTDRPEHRALHGLVRTLVFNMVHGVSTGYEKQLEIQGTGYRATQRGSDVEFALGYSHPILVKPPEGIELAVPNATTVVVRGIDKQAVGQIAANIRGLRPPEPYKGKGIRYAGEYVAQKAGKRA